MKGKINTNLRDRLRKKINLWGGGVGKRGVGGGVGQGPEIEPDRSESQRQV